ncbi:MAG: DUF6498-containing protein [Pseudomonadota bacterium]
MSEPRPGPIWLTSTGRERTSGVVLLLANLVPLAGMALLGWNAFLLLVIYWLENVVVGVLNLFRMAVCRGPNSPWPAKLFMIPFFALHYGGFTFGHGVFVFGFFGGFSEGGDQGGAQNLDLGFDNDPIAHVIGIITEQQLLFAVAALAVSHLISFGVNFIGGGEYRRVSLQELMGAPYGRVVVLHVTIILGGGAAMSLGNPMWALLLLVGLKTAIDLVAHRRSHRKLGEKSAARAPA